MTPPMASEHGADDPIQIATAVLHSGAMETLCKRPDFLRCASARRQTAPGFMVQARARDDGKPLIRVGFTASKKIGNAVARNRAKRRLRALVRAVLPALGRAGWDYVIVAKPTATIARDFAALTADLTSALTALHR